MWKFKVRRPVSEHEGRSEESVGCEALGDVRATTACILVVTTTLLLLLRQVYLLQYTREYWSDSEGFLGEIRGSARREIDDGLFSPRSDAGQIGRAHV